MRRNSSSLSFMTHLYSSSSAASTRLPSHSDDISSWSTEFFSRSTMRRNTGCLRAAATPWSSSSATPLAIERFGLARDARLRLDVPYASRRSAAHRRSGIARAQPTTSRISYSWMEQLHFNVTRSSLRSKGEKAYYFDVARVSSFG